MNEIETKLFAAELNAPVMVHWREGRHVSDGWLWTGGLTQATLANRYSVGYLVHRDTTEVKIAMTIDRDAGGEDQAAVQNLVSIPVGAIVDLWALNTEAQVSRSGEPDGSDTTEKQEG